MSLLAVMLCHSVFRRSHALSRRFDPALLPTWRPSADRSRPARLEYPQDADASHMPIKIGSISQALPRGETNMSARAIFRTVSANISRLLGRLFGSDPTFGPQDWHVDGNAGINPGAHFLGTTDNAALVLRTNNIPRLWITAPSPFTRAEAVMSESGLD